MKLRLTPNLTIDATVNPDFWQVNADVAVLNLDAAEVFVGERRPFFVEGTGLYRFALNCSIVNCTSDGLFYSRRIGRAPELRSRYGDASTPMIFFSAMLGNLPRDSLMMVAVLSDRADVERGVVLA